MILKTTLKAFLIKHQSLFVGVLIASLLVGCGGSGSSEDQGPPLDLVMNANKEDPNSFELFATSIDGSRIVKLSPEIEYAGNDVLDFSISPSGEYVAFRMGHSMGVRLHVVSLKTFDVVEVSSFLGDFQGVSDYSWSSDNRYLAFIGEQQGIAGTDLYTIRMHDLNRTQINVSKPTRVVPVRVVSFQWSPDASSIAYIADEELDNKWELYATSPEALYKRKVSGDLVTGSGSGISKFSWSPDGTLIAYLVLQWVPFNTELYRSHSDGTGQIKLSNDLSGVEVEQESIQWSPDGSLLQYLAYDPDNNTSNLFVVDRDGAVNTRVSTNIPNGGRVRLAVWSPNGRYIAFVADVENDGIAELYTALPDGSGINVMAINGNAVYWYPSEIEIAWSPDGAQLAFGGRMDVSDSTDLFISSADGTGLSQITQLTPINSGLIDYVWSPDNRNIVFRIYGNDSYQITSTIYDTERTIPSASTTSLSPVALYVSPKWIDGGEKLAYVEDANTLRLGELFISDGGSYTQAVSGEFDTLFSTGTGVSQFAEILQ